jgi:hypothetical protein
MLREQFPSGNGSIPVIDLQVETVSEGRAKPKWLGIELLKLVEHPMYKHIGAIDEGSHYSPSKGRDEGTVRIALKEGFNYRRVERVCLDEGHLLTRTKDAELRASILESLKSSCAIKRSLIIAGGYELAYKGLFDSAHFAGRVTTYDYGSYSPNNPVDVNEWKKVSKTFSVRLDLEPETLLTDRVLYTMVRCNGTVGVFERWLWSCKCHAAARSKRIDFDLLHACSPPAKEIAATKSDIELGRSALAALPVPRSKPKAKAEEDKGATAPKKAERKPFERSPNRSAAETIEVLDED